MGIENVSRVQWVLIGLAVGGAMAYLNTQVEPGSGISAKIDPNEFAGEIQLKDVAGGTRSRLEDVTVYPAVNNFEGKPVYVITMTRWIGEGQAWRARKSKLEADVPFMTYADQRRGAAPVDPNRTVVSYLENVAATNPNVHYRYAWWAELQWRIALWVGGCAVVIGGIWPSLIRMLIASGLVPKPEPKTKSLFEMAKEAASMKGTAAPEVAANREMSDEERDALQSQLDNLEQNVVGMGMTGTDVPVAAGQQGGQGEIRKLSGGPVEVAAVQQEEEDKSYKGEFYPVAMPQTHPKDDGKKR